MSEPSPRLSREERAAGLAFARQWRIDNKPYFDAIYGSEDSEEVIENRFLDRALTAAQTNFRHALALVIVAVVLLVAAVALIAVQS